jgi:hypothetical protein
MFFSLLYPTIRSTPLPAVYTMGPYVEEGSYKCQASPLQVRYASRLRLKHD